DRSGRRVCGKQIEIEHQTRRAWREQQRSNVAVCIGERRDECRRCDERRQKDGQHNRNARRTGDVGTRRAASSNEGGRREYATANPSAGSPTALEMWATMGSTVTPPSICERRIQPIAYTAAGTKNSSSPIHRKYRMARDRRTG